MRRSQGPCRVCVCVYLPSPDSDGALILLLSSEIGLAANNILFIPNSIRPLMHLEKYAI